MRSPVTQSTHVKKLGEMDVKPIIKKYMDRFQVDVSRYFIGVQYLEEWLCMDTGYRFFYPFTVSGDHYLYEQLQQKEWYYMSWKWEHEMAIGLISNKMNVLEIGCGKGAFLAEVEKQGAIATGLEQNKNVIKKRNSEKPIVLYQTIEEHAEDNKDQYDVICIFQVLEHIYNVSSFLDNILECLKSNGLLIVSVPNNNSFIKNDRENVILNLPPHHMGMWDKISLSNLPKIYNVELKELRYEPLQQYHYNWYQSILENRFMKNNRIREAYNNFDFGKYFKRYISWNAHRIKGSTLLAIYYKR